MPTPESPKPRFLFPEATQAPAAAPTVPAAVTPATEKVKPMEAPVEEVAAGTVVVEEAQTTVSNDVADAIVVKLETTENLSMDGLLSTLQNVLSTHNLGQFEEAIGSYKEQGHESLEIEVPLGTLLQDTRQQLVTVLNASGGMSIL